MDDKQKADYLADPNHCPFCNSHRVIAEEFNTDSFTQAVECADCGKQWMDVYTLTSIEPLEPIE